VSGPGEKLYGSVFVRNFDQGVMDQLGAKKIKVERDNELVSSYILDLPEMNNLGPKEFNYKIPIVFWPAEGVYEFYFLPSIYIKPGDYSIDLARWEPGGTAYRYPADNARFLDVYNKEGLIKQGYDYYEQRVKSIPVNIYYDIEIRARKRWQKILLLSYVLKQFIDREFYLVDSIGNNRSYYMNIESVSGADEFADIGDRTLTHIVSIMINGELDLHDAFTNRAMTDSEAEKRLYIINE
jgi:hypothetical protein